LTHNSLFFNGKVFERGKYFCFPPPRPIITSRLDAAMRRTGTRGGSLTRSFRIRICGGN
jgi:hypothetical protein